MKLLTIIFLFTSATCYSQLKGLSTYSVVESSSDIPYFQGGFVKKEKMYWYSNDKSECGVNAVINELYRILEVNEIDFTSYQENSELPENISTFSTEELMNVNVCTLYWSKENWLITFTYSEFGTTVTILKQ
uniref:hypothetical protein n=1 Tax=Flavobacterium sp. TaxID=239 RepID=UPI00404A68BB